MSATDTDLTLWCLFSFFSQKAGNITLHFALPDKKTIPGANSTPRLTTPYPTSHNLTTPHPTPPHHTFPRTHMFLTAGNVGNFGLTGDLARDLERVSPLFYLNKIIIFIWGPYKISWVYLPTIFCPHPNLHLPTNLHL